MWQDMVFLVGGIALTAPVIYALWNSDTRWPLESSALTAIIMVAYTYTMYTLSLPYGAVMNGIGCILWIGIALFRNQRGWAYA